MTSPPDPAPDEVRENALAAAPVIWLLGKAQSGKTSVVAELTGMDREGVGNGFQRTTLSSKVYPFPPELPVVQFLDTRGLEDDIAMDPGEAMAYAEDKAHLLLVVVRVEDPAPEALLNLLRGIRKRHPDWPLLVAQTRLHDLYEPGQTHPLPYPFTGGDSDAELPGLSADLRDALSAQRAAFTRLPGSPPLFVPLDFTKPDSGLSPSNYGGDALWEGLKICLPLAYEGLHTGSDPAEQARKRVILPWSLAAAGTDALPLPLLGGLASTGLQARMVVAVAGRFGLDWSPREWRRFVRLLGASFVARYGAKFLLRQGLKVIPGVGAATVALLSFGVTYALGEAAIYYCRELSEGREPDREQLRQTYVEHLEQARDLWRERSKLGVKP